MSFDAARRGAETVDRVRFGVGERKGDGGFERRNQVAQGANGMGGDSHANWMHAISPKNGIREEGVHRGLKTIEVDFAEIDLCHFERQEWEMKWLQ